jgi:hypothetical protein
MQCMAAVKGDRLTEEMVRSCPSFTSDFTLRPLILDLIEHEGGITGKKFTAYWALNSTSSFQLGYHTCIARLPDSKLGIAVFTNDDDYGASFMQVIKWRIIDTVLGMEPIDWDSRYTCSLFAPSISHRDVQNESQGPREVQVTVVQG